MTAYRMGPMYKEVAYAVQFRRLQAPDASLSESLRVLLNYSKSLAQVPKGGRIRKVIETRRNGEAGNRENRGARAQTAIAWDFIPFNEALRGQRRQARTCA